MKNFATTMREILSFMSFKLVHSARIAINYEVFSLNKMRKWKFQEIEQPQRKQ